MQLVLVQDSNQLRSVEFNNCDRANRIGLAADRESTTQSSRSIRFVSERTNFHSTAMLEHRFRAERCTDSREEHEQRVENEPND